MAKRNSFRIREVKMEKYEMSRQTVEKLENNFMYHTPKDDQMERYKFLRDEAKKLAFNIVRSTPISREQSLALTNLEEAIFWANAAIARNE